MALVFRRLRRDDGQGLIELIVALTILAVGIGAVLTVLTGSALSLQRSDQKGTALTLAETQIELYRNLAYPEIRLDDASWSSAPLTSGSDPYFTAHASDPSIPSGAMAGEVTDTGTGITACAASPPPECQAVRTVTGPDHRQYRIDTYITTVTPTSDGTSTGTPVGNPVRQVTVIVRNAQLSTLPILARNSSTFSDVNAAAFGGKAFPNLAINVPRAWVTSASGTSIPASSISVTVSNGLYPLSAGSTSGVLTLYAMASSTSPSPPCGKSASWVQIGTATVNAGNTTYQMNGAATVVAGNTYWWYVTFSGDSSNEARNSRCSPAMTTTKVQSSKWSPSISVTAPTGATTGVQVPGSSFTAVLVNSAPGATGTIHIKYVAAASAPSSCPAGTELGTASATGDGSYSQANGFTGSSGGVYWWWATYDGDSNDNAATSVCGSTMPSTTVGAGPGLVSMVMKDTNNNGKIDHVVATFDKTLGSCTSPCTTGWTLSNVPSSGTLSSVTTSGSTATLTLSEGTGAQDTTVGGFTLALDSSSGIVDTSGRHGSFAATAPSDGAGPVPISMTSTNKALGTAGKAEAGDKVAVTFSEPIATIGGATTSTVTMTTASGSSKPVTLDLTGLTSAAFQIGKKNNYMSGNAASAIFGSAGSSITFSGSQVTVTLGTWNNGGTLQAGSYVSGATGPYLPAATIKDAAGNAAVGSLATTITFF
jgi:type II secretory pathway pseudopilin PulG